MKRLIAVALVVAAALTAAAVVLAATTRTISASPTKLAYSKKALVAKPGKVTLRMTNPSSILKHNIALRKGTTAKGKLIVKGKVVGKGGLSKVTATLKAGKYRYLCTVAGHEAGGMWGILTVKR